MARRKFETRFLPDEEARAKPEVTKTILLGIVMITAGIGTVVTSLCFGLSSVFDMHFMDVVSGGAVGLYIWITLIKTVVSVLLIISGIILIRSKTDLNAVHTANERVSLALKIWIGGLLIYLIGFPFFISLLTTSINSVLYTPFPLLGLPFLKWLAGLTQKKADGKNVPEFLWWVIFILTAVFAIVSLLLAGYLVGVLSGLIAA